MPERWDTAPPVSYACSLELVGADDVVEGGAIGGGIARHLRHRGRFQVPIGCYFLSRFQALKVLWLPFSAINFVGQSCPGAAKQDLTVSPSSS